MRSTAVPILIVFMSACRSDPPPPPDASREPPRTEAPRPREPAVPPVDKEAESAMSTDAPADLAAPPATAQETRSGLAFEVLRTGTGEAKPLRDDLVTFHYVSWSPDGKLTSTSYDQGKPKEMKVARMLAGWREAIGQMVVGERRRLWIPARLAHPRREKVHEGDRRVVDLELVALARAPVAPKDVKRPPKDAKKTKSGLAYKVLVPGKGEVYPSIEASVVVRYAGWTTDGRCFDFTGSGETATFALRGVIAGWAEGIQQMVVGQKTRLWIPKKLAYKGRPGKPQGMLVFDVELVEITEPGG